jgi:hypothetical protein
LLVTTYGCAHRLVSMCPAAIMRVLGAAYDEPAESIPRTQAPAVASPTLTAMLTFLWRCPGLLMSQRLMRGYARASEMP